MPQSKRPYGETNSHAGAVLTLVKLTQRDLEQPQCAPTLGRVLITYYREGRQRFRTVGIWRAR